MKPPVVLLAMVAAVAATSAKVQPDLECVCSKHTSECDRATARCTTDGMCFSSLKRIKSKRSGNMVVVRIDRCVDADYLIPRQRPLICEYNRHRNYSYISACCDSHSLCNSQALLPLK